MDIFHESILETINQLRINQLKINQLKIN